MLRHIATKKARESVHCYLFLYTRQLVGRVQVRLSEKRSETLKRTRVLHFCADAGRGAGRVARCIAAGMAPPS